MNYKGKILLTTSKASARLWPSFINSSIVFCFHYLIAVREQLGQRQLLICEANPLLFGIGVPSPWSPRKLAKNQMIF
jgi:hypothetical protein